MFSSSGRHRSSRHDHHDYADYHEHHEKKKPHLITWLVMFFVNLLCGAIKSISSIQASMAGCLALCSAGFAALGYSALVFLAFTRYYAPATHEYVRPLHFDYSGPVAVAEVPLAPALSQHTLLMTSGTVPPGSAPPIPNARVLPPGQLVSVHLLLLLPEHHRDLFQVTGELLTVDGTVTARAARTHIHAGQRGLLHAARNLLLLPLHALGWAGHDGVAVRLRLLEAYEEREDAPLAGFRVSLASRNSSRGALPPPPVYSGQVTVRLRLGVFRTLLLWLRPGLLLSVALLAMGLCTALPGTAGALVFGGLAFFLWRLARKAAAAAEANSAAGAPPTAKPVGGPYGYYGGGRGGRGGAPPALIWQQRTGSGASDTIGASSEDDAMGYSIAHAQYARGGAAAARRRSSGTAGEASRGATAAAAAWVEGAGRRGGGFGGGAAAAMRDFYEGEEEYHYEDDEEEREEGARFGAGGKGAARSESGGADKAGAGAAAGSRTRPKAAQQQQQAQREHSADESDELSSALSAEGDEAEGDDAKTGRAGSAAPPSGAPAAANGTPGTAAPGDERAPPTKTGAAAMPPPGAEEETAADGGGGAAGGSSGADGEVGGGAEHDGERDSEPMDDTREGRHHDGAGEGHHRHEAPGASPNAKERRGFLWKA